MNADQSDYLQYTVNPKLVYIFFIKFLKYVHKKWHKSLPWALVLGPPRPPSRTRRSHLSSVEPASQPQSAGPAPRGLKITVYNTQDTGIEYSIFYLPQIKNYRYF